MNDYIKLNTLYRKMKYEDSILSSDTFNALIKNSYKRLEEIQRINRIEKLATELAYQ